MINVDYVREPVDQNVLINCQSCGKHPSDQQVGEPDPVRIELYKGARNTTSEWVLCGDCRYRLSKLLA